MSSIYINLPEAYEHVFVWQGEQLVSLISSCPCAAQSAVALGITAKHCARHLSCPKLALLLAATGLQRFLCQNSYFNGSGFAANFTDAATGEHTGQVARTSGGYHLPLYWR